MVIVRRTLHQGGNNSSERPPLRPPSNYKESRSAREDENHSISTPYEEAAWSTFPAQNQESPNKDGTIFRVCELVGAAALLAAVELVAGAMPHHLRAIPFQAIDNIQETTVYVRNLMFDQERPVEATVGNNLLLVLGIVLPLLLQLAMVTWCAPSRKRPFDRLNTLVSYVVAFFLTALIVRSLKLYSGYLRPGFYGACAPDSDYELCTDGVRGRNGRESFPSGHASDPMAGLGSLSAFLHHRFGTGSVSPGGANAGTHRIARLWSLLAVGPVLLALFVGATRVHDNFHHPADVVGGFAVGGSAAYFCHHVWFLE